MSRTKTLWIREPYLSQILAGRKTVEVRVGYDNVRRLQPGDRLKLNDQHLVSLRRVAHYADFEQLLAHEDPSAIAPDLPPGELLAALRQLYPPDKEALGAVALEVEGPPLSSPPQAGGIEELASAPSVGGTLHLASPPLAGGTEGGRYDALLFDMGYTLVHFEPPQEVIAQQALRAAGAERSPEQIQAAVEAVWAENDREAATATFPATPEYDREAQSRMDGALLARLGLDTDPHTLQAFSAALDSAFSRPGVIRPFPEVLDVLAALREQGHRLGIVSNWSWNLRQRVSQAGLDGFFEVVWASAYAGCKKPHPAIFHQALSQLGVAAQRALYVGDSYKADVVGARSAGLDVLLLDRPGTAGDVDCPVIRDLWGVVDWLRQ